VIRICDRLDVELREAGKPTPRLTHGFDHLLPTPGRRAGFLLSRVFVFAAFCKYASACFCVAGFLELRKGEDAGRAGFRGEGWPTLIGVNEGADFCP
jgi:hypothetical protein